MALNELGARHVTHREMRPYNSQPPADHGGFGEFNGFSFRHELGVVSLLFWVASALAGDVKSIPKAGACPPGYYSSGNYCVPRKAAHPVIEKHGQGERA